MRKVTAGSILRGLLGRALDPRHLCTALRLHLARKRRGRTGDDPRLALYSRVFPTGFLHYGYFDDPDVRPDAIGLADVEAAQRRYAEVVVELAGAPRPPALDIGCGMGGLSRMLAEAGFAPTALTPSRAQAAHVERTLSQVPVIRSKFEALDAEAHRGRYGTLVTAESLQYLRLDPSLPRLARIVRPDGQWIACDVFRSSPDDTQSGHVWDEFVERVGVDGWRITYERDLTPHVVPTLRLAHMCATRFGLPLMDYAIERLDRRQPGVRHLLEDVRAHVRRVVDENLTLIDPDHFAATKRYMLLRLERT